MVKRVPDYVKYTAEELDKYQITSGSCVRKDNAILHLNINPHCLKNFKKSLVTLLARKRIGTYDRHLKGIVLDIRNIKLLNTSGAIRFDDPRIHVDIKADCYYFAPTVGAIVRGVVRHVSSTQIGVTIYRVFSVSIRLINKPVLAIKVNSKIDFRIKKYNLDDDFPFIEGELVDQEIVAGIKRERKQTEMTAADDCADSSYGIKQLKKEV